MKELVLRQLVPAPFHPTLLGVSIRVERGTLKLRQTEALHKPLFKAWAICPLACPGAWLPALLSPARVSVFPYL
jgi:hypothetical protein